MILVFQIEVDHFHNVYISIFFLIILSDPVTNGIILILFVFLMFYQTVR